MEAPPKRVVEQPRKTKGEVIKSVYQMVNGECEQMEKFHNLVLPVVIDYLNANEKQYKNWPGVWHLFDGFPNFFKFLRQITREFFENSRDSNINGSFTSWTQTIPHLVSVYLGFFHDYHLNQELFEQLRQSFQEFDEMCISAEKEYGMEIGDYFKQVINLLPYLLKELQPMKYAIPPTANDFTVYENVVDQLQTAIQKSNAATTDDIPQRYEGCLFAKIKNHDFFGTICEAYKPDTCDRYKAHIISKISNRSQLYLDQIKTMLEALDKSPMVNILKVEDKIEDELFYYIIYPFTEEMELSAILQRGGKLPEEAARPIFRQLMHAIQHLHSLGIVHGHITPQNMIIHNGKVRLYDFSYCHFAKRGEKKGRILNATAYACPDSLKGHTFDGTAADIWSAGVILFEMLTGKPLFNSKNEDVLKAKIIRCTIVYPKEFSPSIIPLLHGILTPLSTERLSTEQILSHPWMKKIHEVTMKNLLSATPPVSPSVSPLATRPTSPFK